jgi:Zn-dependent peptidase ImmA (M78 family)
MTQADIAIVARTGVRAVKAYEAGIYAPTPDRLRALARKLAFPVEFFLVSQDQSVVLDKVAFDAPSMLTAEQKNRALGSAALAVMLDRWIRPHFALPMAAIPTSMDAQEPEVAAQTLRRAWKLGRDPIENLIALFEHQGIRLFSMPPDIADLDTFSFWSDGRPYIFLSSAKPAATIHFDAARGLARFVLAQPGSVQGDFGEQATDRFAKAFLLPQQGIVLEKPTEVSVDAITTLAKRWHVSPALLLTRMKELGLLSVWKIRTLQAAIAGTPPATAAVPCAVPPFLAFVFATLCAKGMTKRSLAIEASLQFEDIDALTFRHASAEFSDVADSAQKKKIPLKLTVVRP